MARDTKSLAENLFERIPFWQKNPAIFCEEMLGIKLPIHQRNIINSLIKYDKISVRSSNSVGKSFLASALIIWFFFCYLWSEDENDSVIVVFTAPVFNQVRDNIFANIKEHFDRANKIMKKKYGEHVNFAPKISENQNLAEVRWGNKNYIQGVSGAKENTVVGKHATHVLLVYDEAQGVPEKIYSDFNGIALSGQKVRQIMIGNTTLPDGKTGKFYESFGKNSTFHQIKITAFDTPNFIETGITLEDYFLEETDHNYWRKKLDRYCKTSYSKAVKTNSIPDWKEQTALRLPDKYLINPNEVFNILYENGMNPDSYEVQTRVLAEFPSEDSASLYSADHISRSFENYENIDFWVPGDIEIGVDVAGGTGRDQSSIAVRNGNKIIYSESFDLKAHDLIAKIKEVHYQFNSSLIKIERDAIGKPIFDILENDGLPVVGIQAGGGPGNQGDYSIDAEQKNELKKKMFNKKRDEMCWNIRELLSPAYNENPILLPVDAELKRQMSAYSYKKMPNGKILISSKDDLRKLLKKSPDKFDAIVIAFADSDGCDILRNDGTEWITFSGK